MVGARLDVLPADPPREGHLVKARYMPDQVMVTGVDEQGTTHHGLLSPPISDPDLEGMPVVVADLHPTLPAVPPGPPPPARAAPPRLEFCVSSLGSVRNFRGTRFGS